jgi:hypothetical protein
MTMRSLLALGGLVAALVVIAFGAWLVFDDESSGAERGASIDEIVGAPAAWAGARVEVSGRVVSVYPSAFTVGTRDAELLVLPEDGGAERPVRARDVGERLVVRGVVGRFDEQTDDGLGCPPSRAPGRTGFGSCARAPRRSAGASTSPRRRTAAPP